MSDKLKLTFSGDQDDQKCEIPVYNKYILAGREVHVENAVRKAANKIGEENIKKVAFSYKGENYLIKKGNKNCVGFSEDIHKYLFKTLEKKSKKKTETTIEEENEENKKLIQELISEDKKTSVSAGDELAQAVSDFAKEFFSDFPAVDNLYRHETIGEFDPRIIPLDWVKNAGDTLKASVSSRPGDLAYKEERSIASFPVSTFYITAVSRKKKDSFDFKALKSALEEAFFEIAYKMKIQAIQPILNCLIDNSQILVSEDRGKLNEKDSEKLRNGVDKESEFSVLTSLEMHRPLLEGFKDSEITSMVEFGPNQNFNVIFGALAGEKTFEDKDGNQLSFDSEKMDIILAVENKDNNLFKISISDEGNIFDVNIYLEDNNVCLEITTECSYAAFSPVGAVAMIV